MPTPPVRTDNWANGANNIAPDNRLPDGFVRRAVNVDPAPGGRFHLRSGYRLVAALPGARGVLALRHKLLVAAGADLVEFNTRSNSHRVSRQITGAGQLVGDVLNDRLYFLTATEALEYDGESVRQWGVPDVRLQPLPVLGAGSMLAGQYRLAVTFSDAAGREGGTDAPLIFAAPAAAGLTVQLPAPPAGGRVNLYLSHPNSESLYLQDSSETAKSVTLTALRDDTRLLTTTHLIAPSSGSRVCRHGSQLAIASGNTVWMTAPMRPHLIDPRRGFFQYPAKVGELMSDGSTLYVSADRCYAVLDAATDAPIQREVLDVPAQPGSAVRLPDGRCAWMTRYGQAIAVEGGLELVNRKHYAPVLADSGAAAVVEHNGNQLIVTTARGSQGRNPLAASKPATWE